MSRARLAAAHVPGTRELPMEAKKQRMRLFNGKSRAYPMMMHQTSAQWAI